MGPLPVCKYLILKHTIEYLLYSAVVIVMSVKKPSKEARNDILSHAAGKWLINSLLYSPVMLLGNTFPPGKCLKYIFIFILLYHSEGNVWLAIYVI